METKNYGNNVRKNIIQEQNKDGTNIKTKEVYCTLM